RAAGAAAGVVQRAVGRRALQRGTGAPRAVRAGLDDGRPARVAAPQGARLFRDARPSRRRVRHDAGRAVSPARDAVGAPPAGAHARAAHRRGPGPPGHRRRGAESRRRSMKRAPLHGIRVADFTWVWAGPHCTLQLANLGAEVIRVETSTRICVTRMLPPFANFEMGPNRSGYFNQYNQGKKSLALDLKQPEALEVAKRLCAASD